MNGLLAFVVRQNHLKIYISGLTIQMVAWQQKQAHWTGFVNLRCYEEHTMPKSTRTWYLTYLTNNNKAERCNKKAEHCDVRTNNILRALEVDKVNNIGKMYMYC